MRSFYVFVRMLLKRIPRAYEIGKVFSWRDPWTRATLFPPYRGWDVGCGYCKHHRKALRNRRCERAEDFEYSGKCGEF